MANEKDKPFLNPETGFFLIVLGTGLIFLRSGVQKVLESAGFVGGFPKTIAKFASENPNPLVKDFLNGVVLSNADVFSRLVILGEVAAGVLISVMAVYFLLRLNLNKNLGWLLIAGLSVGLFLNIQFFLAAGWMSPSTESLNLLMAGIQAVGILVVFGRLRR